MLPCTRRRGPHVPSPGFGAKPPGEGNGGPILPTQLRVGQPWPMPRASMAAMSWSRALFAALLILQSQSITLAACVCVDEPAEHGLHGSVAHALPPGHTHTHAHSMPSPHRRDVGSCPVSHGPGDTPEHECECAPTQPLALEQAWPISEGLGRRVLAALDPAPALGGLGGAGPVTTRPPPYAPLAGPPCPSSSSPSTLPVLLV